MQLLQMMHSQVMGQPCLGDGCAQGSNLEVEHTESWDTTYCSWIQNKHSTP